MKKAIDQNGTITVRNNIPAVWNNIHNYNSVNNTTQQYDDGWRDVVEPPLGVNEKKGVIYFDPIEDYFTYAIEPMTAQDIEDVEYAEAEVHENTRAEAGEDEAKYIFKHLRKLKNDGTITANQFIAAQDLMFDALLPMSYGLWDVTKDRLDNVSDPANQTLLDILNEIRARIDDYINNN